MSISFTPVIFAASTVAPATLQPAIRSLQPVLKPALAPALTTDTVSFQSKTPSLGGLRFGASAAVETPQSLKASQLSDNQLNSFESLFNYWGDRITSQAKGQYGPLLQPPDLKAIERAFATAAKPHSAISQATEADMRFILEKDPALQGKSSRELLLYPSLQITFVHRVAHQLYTQGNHFAARLVSEANKTLTGAEIHPGATLGKAIFIDHPVGLIVGETAQIGDRFHGHGQVLIGSDGKTPVGKRHPTLGNNVTIWPFVSVHGPITVGDGSVIGAGATVIYPVPPKAVVVNYNQLIRLQGQPTRQNLKDFWLAADSKPEKAGAGQ